MLTVYGVTYTFTSNYGSCLQSYALQKTIKDITIKGDICECYLIPISASPGYPVAAGNSIKKILKSIVNRQTRKRFAEFEKQYIKYTEVKPLNCFTEYNKGADAFVCGSDVIWNPLYNHLISAYYLDFAKKYAFAYAPSFGQTDIDPVCLHQIGSMISRLREISVRESKSAEIAMQCTEKHVEIVVDPVLLLSRERWNEIAENDNPFGQYIFVYSVNSTPLLRKFVKKLSAQTQLKVIYSGGNAGAVIKKGIIKTYTPNRWLQLIRDAAYVVTDSFHGTAFSVLYQKTLFTILNGNPDEGFNMRMSGFLNSIGLQKRMYTYLPKSIDCAGVEYTDVDAVLQERIQKSFNFLRRNLESAYQEKLRLESEEI